MATFYATARGFAKGIVTRAGSKKSGAEVEIGGLTGGVKCNVYLNDEGEERVRIVLTKIPRWHGWKIPSGIPGVMSRGNPTGVERDVVLYEGKISDFKPNDAKSVGVWEVWKRLIELKGRT